jgi:hypothetical protein
MAHQLNRRLLALLAGLVLVAGPVGPARAAITISWSGLLPPGTINYGSAFAPNFASTTFTVRMQASGTSGSASGTMRWPHSVLYLNGNTASPSQISLDRYRLRITNLRQPPAQGGIPCVGWSTGVPNEITPTVNTIYNVLTRTGDGSAYCEADVTIRVQVLYGVPDGTYSHPTGSTGQWLVWNP